MDNNAADDRSGIEASLFPLDINGVFEPRLDDQASSRHFKAPIFQNQNHYGLKSNFTPVATPLKGDKMFGAESIVKSPFGRVLPTKDMAVNIGSPSYEKVFKDKGNFISELKPIFESTVKPDHKNLRTFSPELIKDFNIDIEEKGQEDEMDPFNKPRNDTIDPQHVLPSVSNPVLPITKIGCNCRNSQCLKLYCECFRNQTMCKNCTCKNCFNKTSNNSRRSAIHSIKTKNPTAFDPKFKTTKVLGDDNDHESRSNKMAIIISRGCKCKNSNCRKKYCECYQYGLDCSDKCKCESCENGKVKTNGVDAPGKKNGETTEVELNKRADFDIKEELKRKLLEVKKFKLQNDCFN